MTPPLSAFLSVSKSQSVPPQLAGPLGCPSISGGHQRKGLGGYISYAVRSNLKIPEWIQKKKKKEEKKFL